jgi:RimJ/RimL family protein N-acetyltransferase
MSLKKMRKKIIYYTSSPHIDLRLSPYTDFLCHENFGMRPIFPNDWVDLQHCFSDGYNLRYFARGVAWTNEALQNRLLNNAMRNIDPKFPYTTGWTLITHNGFAGCFWAVPSNLKGTQIEISYCIAARFSGKGLTTAAGQLVINALLEQQNFIGTIFATAHPDNKGSVRVLQKLGLEPDPARQGVPKFGSIRNYYQRHILPEKPQPLLWHFSHNQAVKSIKKQENIEIKPEIIPKSFIKG